jgi:hypothetical protein
LVFRNNCSASTRFMDVNARHARSALANSELFRKEMSEVAAAVTTMEGNDRDILTAVLPRLLRSFEVVHGDANLTAACAIFADAVQSRLGLGRKASVRVSVATMALLKVICPSMINHALSLDPIERKTLIFLAKTLQSMGNELVNQSIGAGCDAAVDSTEWAARLDAFASSLVSAGARQLTTGAELQSEVHEVCTPDADGVADWKAFYRAVKRKLDRVIAGLEEESAVGADLATQLLDARDEIEHVRKLHSELAPVEKDKKKKKKKKESLPGRQGLYSVGVRRSSAFS